MIKTYEILPFLILIQKRCKSEIKFRIQLHMIKESQNIFYGFFGLEKIFLCGEKGKNKHVFTRFLKSIKT